MSNVKSHHHFSFAQKGPQVHGARHNLSPRLSSFESFIPTESVRPCFKRGRPRGTTCTELHPALQVAPPSDANSKLILLLLLLPPFQHDVPAGKHAFIVISQPKGNLVWISTEASAAGSGPTGSGGGGGGAGGGGGGGGGSSSSTNDKDKYKPRLHTWNECDSVQVRWLVPWNYMLWSGFFFISVLFPEREKKDRRRSTLQVDFSWCVIFFCIVWFFGLDFLSHL